MKEPQLNRREFIKLGASVLAFLGLTACGVKTETPIATQILTIDPIPDVKKRANLYLSSELGMNEWIMFPLGETGINIRVFTDKPSRLQFDVDAFNQLFNSMPAYVVPYSGSPLANAINYQQQILQSHRQALEKQFAGTEIYLVIPASPNTCITEQSLISKIPQGVKTPDYCQTTGRTITFATDDQGKAAPARFMTVFIHAGIDDSGTVEYIGGDPNNPITLNAEQSVASTSFHEMIHVLLGMAGVQPTKEEELYVSKMDRRRLEFLQQHPEQEIFPVNYTLNSGNNLFNWLFVLTQLAEKIPV